VELYKKVRLACAEGMSARAAAKHFNISRGTVEKMLAFSVPPGYRRDKPIRRPKLDKRTSLASSCSNIDTSWFLSYIISRTRWGLPIMQMNVAEARAKLSQLLAAVDAGEEVVIARDGVPAARLVPVVRAGVRLGLLQGVVDPVTIPDFMEPMSEDELAEWGA
jgi:prevent-host-death family protein